MIIMLTAWVLSTVTSVFFLMHPCQASLVDSNQPSPAPRDDVACSPATRPRVLTDASGWFISPNYPANYPMGATCHWLIISMNTTVTLDFTDYWTERSYDQVRIYNGNTTYSVLLRDLSGLLSPPPTGIHSSGPQMLVVFTSDTIYSYRGFNASYTSSDYVYEPDPCHPVTRPLVLTDFEGTFQSNGFPVAYANNSACQWLFVSQLPDGIVRLEFDFFNTEAQYDFVRIYDGNSNRAPLIGTLTGNNPPDASNIYYSSQQNLFLQFTTDASVVRPGFNGTFRSQLKPTTTAFPPGLCGTNLHVSPREATIPPTHDIMCQLDKVDINYFDTYCVDLIQNLPGIGNADELVKQGGNFGCFMSYEESYEDAQKACYDNYQWFSRLGTCDACTRMYVCIRFK